MGFLFSARRSYHSLHSDAFPQRPEGDADAVAGLRVLDARPHQAPSRTAKSRCGSLTPLSACSPRSSKRTPADVRASERTVSETSTSPGAERAENTAAMMTAPP